VGAHPEPLEELEYLGAVEQVGGGGEVEARLAAAVFRAAALDLRVGLAREIGLVVDRPFLKRDRLHDPIIQAQVARALKRKFWKSHRKKVRTRSAARVTLRQRKRDQRIAGLARDKAVPAPPPHPALAAPPAQPR